MGKFECIVYDMSRNPNSTRTSPERIEDALRRSIISGAIRPQTWLREEALAREFGVSRTPVREACARLANEGLLERVPHRGFRSYELDLRELEEVYPVLVSLELLSLRTRVDAIGPLVVDLRALNFDAAGMPTDAASFYDRDYAWHARLVRACGNSVVVDLHGTLARRIARYIHVYWSKRSEFSRSADEHELIAKAVARDDDELACALLRAHRQQGLERIRRFMARPSSDAARSES